MRRVFTANRLFLALLATALMLALLTACGGGGQPAAKQFPAKPLTLIVWSAAGSSGDIAARQIASIAEKQLGQPIEVTLKEGGSGANALTYLVQQPDDGYTLLLATASLTELFNRQGFPVKMTDIQPVIRLQVEPFALLTPPNSRFKKLQDFVEAAKKEPGKIKVAGIFAAGSHYAGFYKFMEAAKFDATWVPFEGSNKVVSSVMGGHFEAGQISGIGNIKAQMDAGQLKVLGISAAKRDPVVPDIPTYKELGYDCEAYQWRGVIARKGVPDDVLKTLHESFKKAMDTPAFTDFLKQSVSMNGYVGPDDFLKVIKDETAMNEKLIRILEQKGQKK